MLHINKFKFGLKENSIEISKNYRTHFPNSLRSVNSRKKSKKNVAILATIGPKSSSENAIKKISKYTNLFRINGSHNTLDWHVKISKRIKEICPESFILLDIPGLKPRTNNKEIIHIKKDQTVTFSYGNIKVDDGILSIKTTKPLPKIKKFVSEFSVSDGQFIFNHVKNKENLVQGISKASFKLKPQKGLNIPNSYYDNILQNGSGTKFSWQDFNSQTPLKWTFLESKLTVLNSLDPNCKKIANYKYGTINSEEELTIFKVHDEKLLDSLHVSEENTIRLFWTGDLNGDKEPDFFIGLNTHHEEAKIELILSNKSNDMTEWKRLARFHLWS